MDSLKELILAACLFAVSLITGMIIDAVGWCLFIGTLVWIFLQYRQFRRVRNWTDHPLRRPKNGSDTWFQIAYKPFRSLTRERERTRTMGTRLRDLLELVQVIPDGLIVLNSNGDIERINNAAKQLLQLTDRDIGLSLATVVRSPDFVSFIRNLTHEDPLEFSSPFDREKTFEARCFTIETGGRIVLIRDITMLNRLLTMRQNFVANVSHELRTPLTIVNGYLETIADPSQPDELRLSLIDRLPAPMSRMQSLVNDLLLLTQLESTSPSSTKQSIRLNRVMDSAITELTGLLTEPMQIQTNFNSELNILAVEAEIHSVCVNLLSNAIRYSPNGGVIEVSITDVDGKVRLSVQDHGVGIAPEHISRLTERFYRVDMESARSTGGTGLGLAIVKHVLRRHGSALQIRSALGRGSLFFCEFEQANS